MLEHFFGSKTRLKLLKIFFRHPEQAFYVRELARLLDIQMNAVRREIDNLNSLQLLLSVDGAEMPGDDVPQRAKFFRLNINALLFPELKALLAKGELLEEKAMVEEIKLKGGEISLFMLMGYFIKDAEAQTDVLIVGRLKPLVIAKIIKSFENQEDREIRYTLLTDKEFKERREMGDKFLYGLFEAKHLFMINSYNLS